jgi:hypothetical protein
LLAGEEPGLQVLADAAYGSGETLAALGDAGHDRAIKPHPTVLAVPGGFHRDDFVVDETVGTVTCPAGHTVTILPRRHTMFGALCANCPLRSRCTNLRRGRKLRLTPHDAELVQSRRAWRNGDFKDDYRQFRPMVERSIAWLGCSQSVRRPVVERVVTSFVVAVVRTRSKTNVWHFRQSCA